MSTCREYGLSMISCLHHLSQLPSKIFIKLMNKISDLSTCLFASLGWKVTCTCDSFKTESKSIALLFIILGSQNKKDLTIIIFMIHMKAMSLFPIAMGGQPTDPTQWRKAGKMSTKWSVVM